MSASEPRQMSNRFFSQSKSLCRPQGICKRTILKMFSQTQTSYTHSAELSGSICWGYQRGSDVKKKNAIQSWVSFFKNPRNIRAIFQAGAERLLTEWLKGRTDSALKARNESRPVRNIQVLWKHTISFLPHGSKDGGWNEYSDKFSIKMDFIINGCWLLFWIRLSRETLILWFLQVLSSTFLYNSY